MMFQSVYVRVRQLGAWDLHPYNFIAMIYVSFKVPSKIFPFGTKFGIVLNLAVMTVDDSISN